MKEINREKHIISIQLRCCFPLIILLLFSALRLSAQWISVQPILTSYLNQVFFASVDTGYIMSEQQLYKSYDGGHNWNLIHTFSSPGYSKVYFSSTQFGWTSRNDGLYRTTDGGNSWNNIQPSIKNASVHFINDAEGWMIVRNDLDYESYIYHTIDSGFTCVLQYTLNDLLYDLSFPSDSIGYVAGNISNILKTTNKGNSWSHPSPGRLINIEKVKFLNENVGFITGEWLSSYFSLKTINGGMSWIPINLDSTEWHSIYFITSDTGWAIDRFGKIKKSNDGGNVWVTELNSSFSDFTDLFITDFNHGCVIGNSGEVFIMDTSTTQIDPVELSDKVIIYPNPSHDHITIDCGSNYESLKNYFIKVDNILGETVYSTFVNQQKISINRNVFAENGLYLISLINSVGRIEEIRKFVIQ